MTKMMATHHRPGQLNAVLFPHLESLAKVDYLDVVFLLQINILQDNSIHVFNGRG